MERLRSLTDADVDKLVDRGKCTILTGRLLQTKLPILLSELSVIEHHTELYHAAEAGATREGY